MSDAPTQTHDEWLDLAAKAVAEKLEIDLARVRASSDYCSACGVDVLGHPPHDSRLRDAAGWLWREAPASLHVSLDFVEAFCEPTARVYLARYQDDELARLGALSRRFELHRHEDVAGVSGTGHVADGIQWEDGTVTVRWRGDCPTTTVHPSIASVERVHCHNGKTVIAWIEAR